MEIVYKTEADITFADLVELKLLLDEMYQEILITPKQQGDLHGLNNSLGYWQKIMLSENYHLVFAYHQQKKKKIAFSIARFPDQQQVFYIDYVYVQDEYRRQGIARELMRRQVDFAKQKYHLDKQQLKLKSQRLKPIMKTITELNDSSDI